MIPNIDVIRFPMSASLTALMIGIPPATAASQYSGVFCFSESSMSSFPLSASTALLPVTTAFFALSAAVIKS